MTLRETLEIAVDIGFAMLQCGAEIYRVEQSVSFICSAYGFDDTDVFVIPSVIIVTIRDGQENITTSKRLRSQQVDLDKVDRLNALSRYLCEQKPDLIEIRELLKEIEQRQGYPLWLTVLCFAMVSFFFTLFFGGSLFDSCLAFAIGVVTKLVCYGLARQRANPFLINTAAGVTVSLLTQICMLAGLTAQIDTISIGVFMNLVPGVALTNGIRDFISGDFFGGIGKMIEALLIASAIALGAAVVIILFRIV